MRKQTSSPSEIEREIDEMVRVFADQLDVGPEKARKWLGEIFSAMSAAGLSIEQAIEILSEDSEKRCN
jgi:hypothetical protein